MDNPPPRPTSAEDPQQLGYTPRQPVAWLNPGQLAGTAIRVVGAELFGAYLDKRELQGALPDCTYAKGDGELWLDYVADLGDGFDATYSMAWLLAQPELPSADGPAPRGQMLVMGGDEVYPTASWREYEDRTQGPYRTARPAPAPGEEPTPLFAIPGNHDWYDGLTAFLRLFCKANSFGAWRTEQARSYFAIKLPHNWWLFAVDEQDGGYFDDPQIQYFKNAGLQPGDRVILCTPRPTWVYAQRVPHAYDTIDYFVRTVINPTQATAPVMLSGDAHHYAHYTGAERELITCGGGGAYLSATHLLPDELTVPNPASLVRQASPSKDYEQVTTFPSKDDSSRMAWGVFGHMPGRNPGFAFMLGGLHTLLMLAYLSAGPRLPNAAVGAMWAVMLAIGTAFAMPSTGSGRTPKHFALGILHSAAHLALGYAGAVAWRELPFHTWPWPLPLVMVAVVYFPVISLVAAELVGVYLLIASRFQVNVNELFAGQGIEDAKSFLRIHIRPDGGLTIYPYGVKRISRKWTARPDDPPWAPWLAPAEPLDVHPIEAPIRLP